MLVPHQHRRRLAGSERDGGCPVLVAEPAHLHLVRLGNTGLGQRVGDLLQVRSCPAGAQLGLGDRHGAAMGDGGIAEPLGGL
ncbi:hypothetical protein OG930_01990 [Streptomyces sp. NBC_01799]|uniref:hypothetical protein n=1 Tax=Streptomyces sp. NBC_01800 TaxID=2975945 RepID=UPI002DDAB732|nr:hypothetical protein [Streptomyces sp. NBC_01800]WSA74134.1 hypothetical protein OIE65_02130 [Streptomyces sp. NBC_01800]WSA82650.1 hypothetical protein OG930_01990 [Streptomyces sp. NBC_01799]